MKNLLLTVLAYGLLSSSAFAEEALLKKQFTRVVASETNQRIGFFYAVHPDCSASGNVNVRMTKKPEHGTVEITPTSHFPNFEKEAIRFKCNQHRVKGMQINYKSAEKYVGDDAFDLLVLFPAGTAWEVHYDVSVRVANSGAFSRTLLMASFVRRVCSNFC